jgi:hypothetical protein
VWQKAHDDLARYGFTVLAIALDTADAARPWIEAAKPAYPALIDRQHHVAALYGMVNVPEAVWIDENGRIVRPTETAGAYDGFRSRDPVTGTIPPDVAETTARAKRVYMEAVADWARNGAASRHALDPATARERLRRPSDDAALAQTHFRLATWFLAKGEEARAVPHVAEARRLHPESWTIFRQTYGRNDQGLATGDEFRARVAALGERRYYPKVDIEGMP